MSRVLTQMTPRVCCAGLHRAAPSSVQSRIKRQLRDQLLDQNLLGTMPRAQEAIAGAKVRSDFLHQGIGPLVE